MSKPMTIAETVVRCSHFSPTEARQALEIAKLVQAGAATRAGAVRPEVLLAGVSAALASMRAAHRAKDTKIAHTIAKPLDLDPVQHPVTCKLDLTPAEQFHALALTADLLELAVVANVTRPSDVRSLAVTAAFGDVMQRLEAMDSRADPAAPPASTN